MIDDPSVASSILAFAEGQGQGTEFSEAQLADIADGEVSEDEYQASFERYRSCLRVEGYELENVRMDGPMRIYGVPAAAVESGADGQCFVAEHSAVWYLRSLGQEEWNARKQALGLCARDRGVDTTTSHGHEPTVAELEQMLVDAGVDAEDCV